MLKKWIALVLGVLPVMLTQADTLKRSYSFPAAAGWEDISEGQGFSLVSPEGDGVLGELTVRDQPQWETLEQLNERVNAFNNRTPLAQQGKPQAISGVSWDGLLQSQYMHDGGHEFQLVVKTKDKKKAWVFYLASPPGVEASRLKVLSDVLLSLRIN